MPKQKDSKSKHQKSPSVQNHPRSRRDESSHDHLLPAFMRGERDAVRAALEPLINHRPHAPQRFFSKGALAELARALHEDTIEASSDHKAFLKGYYHFVHNNIPRAREYLRGISANYVAAGILDDRIWAVANNDYDQHFSQNFRAGLNYGAHAGEPLTYWGLAHRLRNFNYNYHQRAAQDSTLYFAVAHELGLPLDAMEAYIGNRQLFDILSGKYADNTHELIDFVNLANLDERRNITEHSFKHEFEFPSHIYQKFSDRLQNVSKQIVLSLHERMLNGTWRQRYAAGGKLQDIANYYWLQGTFLKQRAMLMLADAYEVIHRRNPRRVWLQPNYQELSRECLRAAMYRYEGRYVCPAPHLELFAAPGENNFPATLITILEDEDTQAEILKNLQQVFDRADSKSQDVYTHREYTTIFTPFSEMELWHLEILFSLGVNESIRKQATDLRNQLYNKIFAELAQDTKNAFDQRKAGRMPERVFKNRIQNLERLANAHPYFGLLYYADVLLHCQRPGGFFTRSDDEKAMEALLRCSASQHGFSNPQAKLRYALALLEGSATRAPNPRAAFGWFYENGTPQTDYVSLNLPGYSGGSTFDNFVRWDLGRIQQRINRGIYAAMDLARINEYLKLGTQVAVGNNLRNFSSEVRDLAVNIGEQILTGHMQELFAAAIREVQNGNPHNVHFQTLQRQVEAGLVPVKYLGHYHLYLWNHELDRARTRGWRRLFYSNHLQLAEKYYRQYFESQRVPRHIMQNVIQNEIALHRKADSIAEYFAEQQIDEDYDNYDAQEDIFAKKSKAQPAKKAEKLVLAPRGDGGREKGHTVDGGTIKADSYRVFVAPVAPQLPPGFDDGVAFERVMPLVPIVEGTYGQVNRDLGVTVGTERAEETQVVHFTTREDEGRVYDPDLKDAKEDAVRIENGEIIESEETPHAISV